MRGMLAAVSPIHRSARRCLRSCLEAVQILGDVLQVLRKVSHMQHNEPCVRMTSYHSVSRFDQLSIGGKVSSVERPVWMIVQLFVSLIEPIGGSKEGNGVGDVYCDGHVQLPARVPHRIKSRIVDFHQLSRGDVIPQVQAESLENL